MRPIFFAIIISFFSCTSNDAPQLNLTSSNPERIPLIELLKSHRLKKDDVSILIDKSDYQLSVLFQDSVARTYPCVFGDNPVDPKIQQGDRCTPEGKFGVRDLYPHSSWSKFIWIDYPNEESWKKFNKAKSEGLIPEDAKIGGEVGIHAVPENYDHMIKERVNWTWGCISLTRDDVDDLYEVLEKGSEIFIQP